MEREKKGGESGLPWLHCCCYATQGTESSFLRDSFIPLVYCRGFTSQAAWCREMVSAVAESNTVMVTWANFHYK